ncbi:MAG: metalloregulator ArsR/SmtB family transcription factor [Pseudomonadota bacterium]
MDKFLCARFQALSDGTRLAVVERLLEGPASVSDLAKPHAMALPAFTKHLAVLERAGLVRSEKSGRVRTCYINAPALREVDAWFSARRAMWEGRLARLSRHVDSSQGE